MCNIVSKFFLMSQKLAILTDPVNDREHAGAAIVVRKTLICSPELTCTMSKNISVAGIKRLVCMICNMVRYIYKYLTF